MTGIDIHRKLARQAHGETWELLEKKERTHDESAAMIEAAHVSSYHWRAAGNGLNWQRAEWLLARVYSTLGMGERALFHAERCRRLTDEHATLMEDFDLPFALEGLARAHAAAGEATAAVDYFKQAEAAGQRIKDVEDRNYFLLDLRSGQWFGVLPDPQG